MGSRALRVEPICEVLGVSASAYYHRCHGEPSPRAVEDQRLLERTQEVHRANYEAYGYRPPRLQREARAPLDQLIGVLLRSEPVKLGETLRVRN